VREYLEEAQGKKSFRFVPDFFLIDSSAAGKKLRPFVRKTPIKKM